MTKAPRNRPRGESTDRATPVPRRRWRRVRFAARLVAPLAFVLIGAHAWWGWSAERALDKEVAALAAAGEKIYPADVADPPVPDDRNAVVDVRAAIKLLKDSSVEWLTFQQIEAGRILRLPKEPGDRFLNKDFARAIAAVLESNRDVLRALDAATAKPAAHWARGPGEPLLHAGRVEVGTSMHLAMLLRAAALYAHHERDDVAAVRRTRQMLRLSEVVDGQATFAAHAVASAIALLAAKTAAELAPGLSLPPPAPPVVRELIDRLLDADPLTDGAARAMRFGRVMIWDTAKQIAGGRADLLRAADDTPSIRGGRVGCYAAKPLLMEDARIMLRYATGVGAAANAASDWPSFEATCPPDPPEVVGSPRLHFLAAVLLPDFRWYLRGHYRALTACRLAAVSLAAASAAQGGAGAAISSLQQLVPAYLPYVPYDPMAPGARPVRLGKAGDRPVVYSVGDDVTDDGGSDVAPGGAADPPGRVFGGWDRRDFVVHLTRPAPSSSRRVTTRPAN
jgi:hypothetical protein